MFVFVCKQTMCVFACVNAECVCVCVFRMFRMFVCVCMCLQTGSHYGALFGLQIEMLLGFITVFNLNHLFLVLYYQFLTRKLFSIIFYKGILGPKALNKSLKYLGCIKSSSVVNCIGYSSRGPMFHSSYTIGCS